MSQNPTYVHGGGKKNNRTIEEARKAERQLALAGGKSLGVVAEGNGGQRVEEADFEANEIDSTLPMNLHIRLKKGADADDNNSVAGQGEFMSVDFILDTTAPPKEPVYAIKNLISMVRPGLSDSDVGNIIDSLPGVKDAKTAAVLKAWNAA